MQVGLCGWLPRYLGRVLCGLEEMLAYEVINTGQLVEVKYLDRGTSGLRDICYA